MDFEAKAKALLDKLSKCKVDSLRICVIKEALQQTAEESAMRAAEYVVKDFTHKDGYGTRLIDEAVKFAKEGK